MRVQYLSLFSLLVVLSLLLNPTAAQAAPIPPDELAGAPIPVQFKDSAADQLPPDFFGPAGFNLRWVKTFGETGLPYLIDASYLSGPNGLALDGSGNLYVAEETNQRITRFSLDGAGEIAAGVTSVPRADDIYLSAPKDVAIDAEGHIWTVYNHAVKEYDASGRMLSYFPDPPGKEGLGDYEFNDPRSLAFDANGYLFVSDHYHHRVQVYDVSGPGPRLINIIGETQVDASDDAHFSHPTQIAFDSANALYVLDTGNYRVQKCTTSEMWLNWDCTTFFGGERGSDPSLNQMSVAYGLYVDRSDTVWIADSMNGQILKCLQDGSCSIFQDLKLLYGDPRVADVILDADGNLYASMSNSSVIRKFNSNGEEQAVFAGTPNQPYNTAAGYYNRPNALGVDAQGNLYIGEQGGMRLVKVSPNGEVIWAVGQPGQTGSDNEHFGAWDTGLIGGIAVDGAGQVYVPDPGNNRVQVFSADGSYVTTLGVTGEIGADNAHLDSPTSVAIRPSDGAILIADTNNQRIQIFNSSHQWVGTIGVTGSSGFDNEHFYNPQDVAVTASGVVYVADTGNTRVQKCTSSNGLNYTCSTFAGITGTFSGQLDSLHPTTVEVDAAGQVYANNDWANTFNVYNAAGQYLTSIGGQGQKQAQFAGSGSLAVGTDGSVYISDNRNHTVQKFIAGVPGWRQINIDGFGSNSIQVASLGEFNGVLYAGTSNSAGGEIWRLQKGKWELAAAGGLDDPSNQIIDSLLAFKGYLYAGTYNESGGRVYRSLNGVTWTPVVLNGFGTLNSERIYANIEAFRLFKYSDQICASTWAVGEQGAEIWCSPNGIWGSWKPLVTNGFGSPGNLAILDVADRYGVLYASTFNRRGAQLWQKPIEKDWVQVPLPGFIKRQATGLTSLQTFRGYLYAVFHRTTGGGAIILRCRNCNGSDWQVVTDNGFGSENARVMPVLISNKGKLYAVLGNRGEAGMSVLVSRDGVNFTPSIPSGFGQGSNETVYYENAVLFFQNRLVIAATNNFTGGEIWQQEMRLFVPLAVR